jgi:hypothetical protein
MCIWIGGQRGLRIRESGASFSMAASAESTNNCV